MEFDVLLMDRIDEFGHYLGWGDLRIFRAGSAKHNNPTVLWWVIRASPRYLENKKVIPEHNRFLYLLKLFELEF